MAKYKQILFWSFIILLHAIYFSYQAVNKHLYLRDSREYLAEAKNIKNEVTFYCGDLKKQLDFDLYTKRPPLYPVFILIIKTVHDSDIVVLLIQCLLSIFNFYMLIKIFELLNINERYKYLLIPLLILYPAQFIYANLIMAEILFQTLILSAFYFFVKFIKTKTINTLVIYNLLIVAAMLTKPVLYMFWLPNLLFLVYLGLKFKSLRIPFAGIIPLLFVILYCSMNYKRTGYFHYSSIQNINLLNYNTYYLLQKIKGENFAEEKVGHITESANNISDYKQRQKFIKNASIEIILKHKWQYIVFHLKGVVNFFIDPGRFDIYNFLGMEKRVSKGFLYHFTKNGYEGISNYLFQQPIVIIIFLLLIAVVNILKLISFFLFSINKNVMIEIRLILILFVLYIAFATGPLGASRFSVPLFPLMIITFPYFFEKMLKKRIAKKGLSEGDAMR